MHLSRRHFLLFIWIIVLPLIIIGIGYQGMRSSRHKISVFDIMKEFRNRRQIKTIFLASNLFGYPDWRGMLNRNVYRLDKPYVAPSGFKCQLTSSSKDADALIFHGREISSSRPGIHSTRTAQQRWVFVSWESIVNAEVHLDNFWTHNFNWTATYMRNSDIVTPYAKGYVQLTVEEKAAASKQKFYNSSEKTGFAFAVISNCNARKRMEYISALRRHIRVDVFGRCGQPLAYNPQAITNLSRRYRFYLSFENSNCKDYISEKFWSNGLQNSAVTVANGGLSRQDYEAVAPPHSFIYTGDFKNEKKLADFLISLSKNETAYARYFDWKKRFKVDSTFLVEIFMHRLCNRLHTDFKPSVSDINSFWMRKKFCRA